MYELVGTVLDMVMYNDEIDMATAVLSIKYTGIMGSNNAYYSACANN